MYALNLLVLLIAAASVNAEAQFFGYPSFNPYAQFGGYQQYFRNGPVGGSSDGKPEERFLMNGIRPVTLTLVSTTSTITSWVTTTCTTSTAALTTCSPAGRRRRGLVLSNVKGRSLFYADDENEADSIFLPAKPEEEDAIKEPVREVRSTLLAPDQIREGRQLISIGISTITTTVTRTYTDRLTAVCASTTGFSVCS